jgi:uncharacterized protein YidB (DUF937 family)
MSLFNMLAGVAGQFLAGQQNSPALVVVRQLLGAGAQGSNPLEALLRQFQQAGLGETVQSWIGSGQNLPISPDMLVLVLGQSRLDTLARAAGTDGASLAEQLARLLPQLVDGMTPQGRMPDANTVQQLIGQLFRR